MKAASLNIRIDETERDILAQAASASHESLSEFVRRSSLNSADAVLADRRRFALGDEAWAAYEAALDAPAEPRPELVALLRARSVCLSAFERPRRIREDDDVCGFDCGVDVLNRWLQDHALANDRSGMSRVYVTTKDGRVVGYYGLATSVIEHEDAIKQVGRGMPKYPIPALLITRLAVTSAEKRQGLGRSLLRDAMLRAITVADSVGVRALHVHAKTPEARRWYEGFGFQQSPVDEFHLQVTIKTLRASFAAAVAR